MNSSPSETSSQSPRKGRSVWPTVQRWSKGILPALIGAAWGVLACNMPTPPPPDPLTGRWREEAQVLCDTGQEIAPAQPIGELIFEKGSDFKVTWVAFETYVDYWGLYSYDAQTGALTMTVSRGNYIPSDPDLSGTAVIDARGRLVLNDMWLGMPHPIGSKNVKPPGKVCSQRFFKPK